MKDEFVLFSNHHNFMKMSIPLYNKRIRDREIGINLPFANKAESLQLKPRPFICMRSGIIKKIGNQKTKTTFITSVLKVVY